MSDETQTLPQMAEVFDALRKGRHICAEDGALYFALRDNRAAYEQLFTDLGFDFQEHARSFFYFRGTAPLSERAERMAVFMFILIEALATQGETVEESLMTRRFNPDELTHFQTERYRTYMREVGVNASSDLTDLLKAMERLGFVELAPNGTFRFRPPACRFLDLCLEMLPEDVEEETNAGEQPDE